MLVTLGNNISLGANASSTVSYSPESVQKVFIRIEDTSGTDSFGGFVTVQIGSRTICNKIKNFGLVGVTGLMSGTAQANNDAFIELDFGSHICGANENLYVTVQAGANAITAVDVSAVVDEPFAGSMPLQYVTYSDSVFTAPNVLSAVGFDDASGANIDEDDYPITVKTSAYSSAPSIISCNAYYKANMIGDYGQGAYALISQNSIPLDTSFNYNSSAVMDTIITCEQLGSTAPQVSKARNMAKLAVASRKAKIM